MLHYPTCPQWIAHRRLDIPILNVNVVFRPRAFMSSVSLNNSAVHRGSSLISPQSARSSAMFGKSFKQISTLYDWYALFWKIYFFLKHLHCNTNHTLKIGYSLPNVVVTEEF